MVDSVEVDDDLVRDMTEILTSMCARLVWQACRCRTVPSGQLRLRLLMIVRRRDGQVRGA